MEDSNKKRKILVVDDEPSDLRVVSPLLSRDFVVHTAQGGLEALEIAERQGPHAVVLADMRMPGMTGVELLTRLKEESPTTVRVLMTEPAELPCAFEAVNKAGVYRLISKPTFSANLTGIVKEAVAHFEAILAEKTLLQQTVNGAIQAWTDALAVVSPKAFGRAQSIRHGMRQIASYFDVFETWELEVAAMIARVGEVALPPGVLAKMHKEAELNRDERDLWNRVPEIGSKLIAHLPRLQGIARDVLYQSKGFDGTGFPGDLTAGKAIPLAARMLKGLTDYQIAIEGGAMPSVAVTQLKFYHELYDPEVIAAIQREMVEAKRDADAGILRMACRLRDLRAGQRLAEPILTLDEVLVIQRGLVITEPLLDRIRNFDSQIGLRQPIYIEDSRLGTPTA